MRNEQCILFSEWIIENKSFPIPSTLQAIFLKKLLGETKLILGVRAHPHGFFQEVK